MMISGKYITRIIFNEISILKKPEFVHKELYSQWWEAACLLVKNCFNNSWLVKIQCLLVKNCCVSESLLHIKEWWSHINISLWAFSERVVLAHVHSFSILLISDDHLMTHFSIGSHTAGTEVNLQNVVKFFT